MKIIKKIIKKFLGIFGIGFYNTKNQSLISKSLWLPTFKESENKLIKLYYDSQKISKTEKNDSFNKLLRYYSLFQLADHSIKTNKNFDFVECGCFTGHSTWALSKILDDNNFDKKFHIFDSFEGFSELKNQDINLKGQLTPNKIKKQSDVFISNKDFLEKNLSDFNFTNIYKGWIPDRFSEIKSSQFQFLHLDLSLYQPTIDALNFFYPKMIPGGIIVMNSYNMTQFPGEKKAVDEYFKNLKLNFFHELPYGSAFLIK